MLSLETINPRTLGQRIAEARKASGKTQEQIANLLSYSRPTYIAIEKGERIAKPTEIAKLADYFGRRVHELVRPGDAAIELQPSLLAVAEKMPEADRAELRVAIEELQRLAEDYRELERLMNVAMKHNHPPAVNLSSRLDVVQLAESVAIQERQRLGLGDQPVMNLRGTLEWEVGLRVFHWQLPPALAGMHAHAADLGGCLLVNKNHPAVQRRLSTAHEYGHLILNHAKPGIDYLTYRGRKPANERFAEIFASCFLMPASSVQQLMNGIVSTTGDFQVADLCRLSHFYLVSVEAMTLRLEQLGLAPKGSWQSLKESGSASKTAATRLALPSHSESNEPYPDRYMYLAVQAFEEGKISQGQLARFLRCDPMAAREIVARCLTAPHVEQNGEQRTLKLDFQRSLLGSAR